MNKDQKNQAIDALVEDLKNNSVFYLTDTSELTVEDTNKLRGNCFKSDISLHVVKNTLLRKAMERSENAENYEQLHSVLAGPTAIMFSEVGNAPAKVIKEFRKKHDKPILKAAYVEEECYIGDDQLQALVDIKSRDELLGEIIGLLQSPPKNLLSALQSGGSTIAGVVKTLSERPE